MARMNSGITCNQAERCYRCGAEDDVFQGIWFRRTSCCERLMCPNCVFKAVCVNIWKDLWLPCSAPGSPFNDGFGIKVTCPVTFCDHRVFCRDLDGLFLFLGSLGIKRLDHAWDEEWQLRRAFQHQAQLNTSFPNMTETQVYLTKQLHSLLTGVGAMWPLDGNASYGEINIAIISIEEPGQPLLKLPLFTHLLKTTAKTCAVCCEDYVECNASEEAVQRILTEGFDFLGGSWTSDLWSFPSRSSLPDCWRRHALDTCWSCLSAYITTKVEDLGISDDISCPHDGCGNVFTHEQIKQLASEEAFERYERLQLVRCLSDMDDFRWCLAENCEAGQFHDLSRCWALDPARNFVDCHSCGFQMCYHHQMPWHANRSCEQYNKERDQDQATVQWVADHTKPCPSCNAPVEKGSGCFHMTCRKCRAEYCWLCMADWHQIVLNGPYGHKPECIFSQTTVRPTAVNGRTTEEAIEGIVDLMGHEGPWRFR